MPRKKDGGACGRCRARHLKCDEQRPGCVRCVTSNIQCPGYFQETKFLYQGAGLRRKFHYVENGDILAQKRQNAEPIYEGPPGLAVVLDKSGNGSCRLTRCITQDKTGVGSERTINETSEREPQSTNVPSFVNGPHVAEVEEPAPSEVSIPTIRASVEDYDNVPDLPETPHPTFESSGTESFQLNDESLSENLQAVFPSTSKPSSQVTQPREASETEVDDALEVLFLIRHFSETVGPWLDLYDQSNYFSTMIPVEATSCFLLKYAACAIAAKQLGRVKGKKANAGGICSQPATTESFPDSEDTNWCFIAANYYDKAITCLQQALIKNVAQQCLWTCNPDKGEESRKRRRVDPEIDCSRAVDGLLACTSILSVYEFMDGSNLEWSRHLSGVKSLLDAANVIVMPQVTKASRAQLATFWNFARCDYLAAFINRTKTRLDTDDLSLWRAAGLQIEEYDEVQSNSRADTSQPSKQSNIREDMLSNKLVWILSKLMNQLATESKEQGDKAATWVSLERELERWFQSLPDTFSPAGRFEPDSKSADPTRSLFAESFYSIPLCAVTMQHYHFAQVMLLLHKPRENSNSVRDQLRRYREIPDRIAYHCKEICAIALGRPPGYVRIHMLQPLFIAGQCLESADERNIILDLLRGIERDLGWATQYRVRELLAEWNWEDDGRWLRYKTR